MAAGCCKEVRWVGFCLERGSVTAVWIHHDCGPAANIGEGSQMGPAGFCTIGMWLTSKDQLYLGTSRHASVESMVSLA